MSPSDPKYSEKTRSRDNQGVGFGRYQIFPDLRLLLRDGDKIELGARAFDVLWMLLEAKGGLVSKDDLIEKIWAGVVVEENNLQAQVSAIRRALGPDRNMISTEFGRGYRLITPRHPSVVLGTMSEERMAPPSLPKPVTALLGRAAELADIERLIVDSRFVTITGPGGIGKTRLAIEIGRRLPALFADGVYLAEIGKIAEGDLMWPTIAAALQMPRSGADSAVQAIATLRDKHLLLIIDNCEHLTEPVAEVVETLLQNGPNLHILVTGQEPLGAEGEHVYRLSPLPVPPAGAQGAEAAISHAAVQLFVERASAVARPFDFSDANADGVSAICRRLDGMPLALELAAARVPSLGVLGVLAGLTDRFNLLTAGRRTALPRHRTLRATVDWSHNLLDDEEQRLFRRLSVFAAEFTGDAARYVGAPEHEEPWRAIDLLGSLVAKSLLLSDLGGPVPRYRLLETVRFYALERLADSGEVTPTALRHAEFFAKVARQAAADWKTAPTSDWRRTYEVDIGDIRAALDWAFSSEGDEQVGVDILAHSTPFWIQLSLHDERQRRLSRVLDGKAIRRTVVPAQEMALQASLGTSLTWAKGPVPETRTAWARALDLALQLSDSEIQLQAHYGLWLNDLRSGQYAESLTHATEMTVLAQHAEDQEALAAGQRIEGVSRHFLGQHSEGRLLIQSALHWYDQERPPQAFRFGLDQRVAGLAFLARILWIQGLSADAMDAATAAVKEARALDHACSLCCALAEGWCMVHALNGDDEAVERGAATLTRVASEHGLGFWKFYGDLFDLWAATRRGTEMAPPDRLDNAIAAVNEMKFDAGYSTLLAHLLLASRRTGRDSSVLTMLAAELAAKADKHWASPEFLRVGAQLASFEGTTTQAQLAKALSIAQAQGARAWELNIAIDLAEALIKDERPREAKAVLDPVLSAFPDGSQSRHWRAAQAICLQF
jgi:predicted ATPase/DNA-binding winged helix-turn-helix (wHTH) protein